MSTKTEIDHVLRQMQHGVRKMTPLVVEQQPERDRVKIPKPAMVVQERWSRSSYQKHMEKRLIEIALERGMSMEEIEEIQAMTNYERPVRTLEEERKARLEMLEECGRMIDRWDEEDAAKKARKEGITAYGNLNQGAPESLESIDLIVEQNPPMNLLEEKDDLFTGPQRGTQEKDDPLIQRSGFPIPLNNGETLICWDQKVEPYFERGKDAREVLLETKREKCAHHVFDQMAGGGVRVTKNIKRLKKTFLDIEKHLENTLSYEDDDNFEMLEIQMENTSKRQRKNLLEWCNGVLSCQMVHTRQRVDKKWLLMFRKKKRKKKKRMTETAKNYGSYDRSERCKKAKRGLLNVMARWLHHHAEKVNRETCMAIEILTGQLAGQRLLSMKVIVKKQRSTRLQQHRRKPTKFIEKETHCRSMRKAKREYEMKRIKLELEQTRLMLRQERVLRKLGKWMKHKFKQKNQWEWIKQGSVLMKSGKFLTNKMRKRSKSILKYVEQGTFLLLVKIKCVKLMMEWKEHKVRNKFINLLSSQKQNKQHEGERVIELEKNQYCWWKRTKWKYMSEVNAEDGEGNALGSTRHPQKRKRPWGFGVCHIPILRLVPLSLRVAFEFLVQLYAMHVNKEVGLENQIVEKNIVCTKTFWCDTLIRVFLLGIVSKGPNIMDHVQCDGAALLYEDKIGRLGIILSEYHLHEIESWLCYRDSTSLSTDSLQYAGLPKALSLSDSVSGMAAVRGASQDMTFLSYSIFKNSFEMVKTGSLPLKHCERVISEKAEEENEVPELPPSKRYSRRTGEKVSARTVDNNTSPSFNSSMSTEDFPPVMTLPTAHVVAVKESVPSALTIVNNDTITAQKPMIPDAENFSAHVLVTDSTAMEVPPSENTSLNSNDNGQKTLTATRGLGKDRGDNDKTVKTPLVITATPLEKTEAEPESVMNLNDFGNDSTPHKTHEEEKSRKTKRGQGQHLKNLNEEADGNTNVSTVVEMNDTTSKNLCHDGEVVDQFISSWIGNSSSELSSDQSLNVMNNSAVAATCTEETPVKDTLTDLPFTKKSPYWKTYETTEGFKSVPQRPHFSKLLEAKKDFFLESAAVGMMVTFYGLLDEVKDLKLDDSTSKLNDLNVYFAELEKNGFDVEAPQAVISKVLSLKDVRDKKAEVQKRSEENIEAEESTSRDLKKKRAELELRISELQRQNAEGKQKEKAAEENIAVMMKAHVEMIGREIEDLEVDFQKTILMYLHGNKLNETSR